MDDLDRIQSRRAPSSFTPEAWGKAVTPVLYGMKISVPYNPIQTYVQRRIGIQRWGQPGTSVRLLIDE